MIYSVQVPNGIWNYVDLDMCQYGMQYRKSTRLLTLQFNAFDDEGVSFLSPLGKRCRGGHEHVTLSGCGAARMLQNGPPVERQSTPSSLPLSGLRLQGATWFDTIEPKALRCVVS